MPKTGNDTPPATKRTLKQCLNMWSRNKIAAWFVITASFSLVVTGGFLLGWRNVLAGVVFGAAATLFGGLLLKYLDWQMKEKHRLELKHAERDQADRIITGFKDALNEYKEAEKIRDNLPEEQQADFEMPNYPNFTPHDLFIVFQSLKEQPLSDTEKEFFKLLFKIEEDAHKYLRDISFDTDIMSTLLIQMAKREGIDTTKAIDIVLERRKRT